MITTILSDFSRVILSPKDKKYKGDLNPLHKDLSNKYGNYQFTDYFIFNKEILNFYKSLKDKYSVNLFTALGSLQNKPEIISIISPIFENIFIAENLNLNKKQSASYIFIANKLKKKPEEILFIDDRIENIKAATVAGLQTIYYINYQNFLKQIKSILNL